jgi:hypothetical protein
MGDWHVDDVTPSPSAVLAAPKLFLVVAHCQQRSVDGNRQVRLANVVSPIENDLHVEERLTQENIQRPFRRFPCGGEQFLPECLGGKRAAETSRDTKTDDRFPT